MPREPEELGNLVVTLHGSGRSQRAIAKELGVTRKQVRVILARIGKQRTEGHTALPKSPVKRASTLDAHAGFITEQLDRYPDISAVRLHEELTTKKGFTGGYTIVKDHLRVVRPQPKRAPVERFETEPGAQGQQDWSPYTIPFTDTGPTLVKCFSFILGYSRRQYIHFCEREDLLTLMRHHVAAGERFGGLPKVILYDNQKAVVLRWEAGRPLYNPRFLAFASHYGFRPQALPPRRPELKGKVERPFQYVEGNCLNARDFRNPTALNEHAETWMNTTSDGHKHDTTGERPIDRFAAEASQLVPLPTCPYDTAEVGYRVVTVEGFVNWEVTPYSVPFAHLLDLVVVRATEHELFIYGRDLTVIACHQRAPRGHRLPVIDPAHRPERKARHDIDALIVRMGELGDAAALFAAGVCKQQRYRGSHLAEALALVARYDAEDLVRALERAVRYRAFDAQVVVRILEATATPRPLPDTCEDKARARLHEAHKALEVRPRALDAYTAALRAGDASPADSTNLDVEETGDAHAAGSGGARPRALDDPENQ
jgi:transposase